MSSNCVLHELDRGVDQDTDGACTCCQRRGGEAEHLAVGVAWAESSGNVRACWAWDILSPGRRVSCKNVAMIEKGAEQIETLGWDSAETFDRYVSTIWDFSSLVSSPEQRSGLDQADFWHGSLLHGSSDACWCKSLESRANINPTH